MEDLTIKIESEELNKSLTEEEEKALLINIFGNLNRGAFEEAGYKLRKNSFNTNNCLFYFYSLMYAFKCRAISDLYYVPYDKLASNQNFQILVEMLGDSDERLNQIKEASKLNYYSKGIDLMDNAEASVDFGKAAYVFSQIKDYKDSEELYQICNKSVTTYALEEKYRKAWKCIRERNYSKANECLDILPPNYKYTITTRDLLNKLVSQSCFKIFFKAFFFFALIGDLVSVLIFFHSLNLIEHALIYAEALPNIYFSYIFMLGSFSLTFFCVLELFLRAPLPLENLNEGEDNLTNKKKSLS